MEVLRSTGLDSPPPAVDRVIGPASYFFAFFSLPQRTLILMGHPPGERIVEALRLPGLPNRLLLSQVEMHSPGTNYEVWDFQKGVASFPLNLPLQKALQQAGMVPAHQGGQ